MFPVTRLPDATSSFLFLGSRYLRFRSTSGEPGLYYLCKGWKIFFRHIDQPVQRIVRGLGAEVIKQPRTAAAEHWVPRKK